MTNYLEQTPEQVYTTLMGAIDWLEANPDQHTSQAYARDADDRKVEPNDPHACSFCIIGRVLHDLGPLGALQVPIPDWYTKRAGIPAVALISANDVSTHRIASLRLVVESYYAKFKERTVV